MADYPISSLVDKPASGSAHIEVFFTSKPGVVYAILPSRPVGEVALEDLEAPRVTLLGSNEPLATRRQANRLIVRMPPSLPEANAYVLKLVQPL